MSGIQTVEDSYDKNLTALSSLSGLISGSTPIQTSPTVRFSHTVGELTAALAAAQVNFKTIKKNKRNPHTNSNYADMEEIVNATQEALSAQGLVIFQAPIVRDRSAGTLSRLSHKSGEFIENELLLPTSMPGKPDKFDAHSIASAITYSKRYSYTGLIGAVAEDDDDGNAAVENVRTPAVVKPSVKAKPEHSSFSSAYTPELESETTKSVVPKAIIPSDLAPETEPFPTPEQRTAYLNRLRYYMKNTLPKAGVENADEALQQFVKRFTGLENTKNYTVPTWDKLLSALDAAKELGRLPELIKGE